MKKNKNGFTLVELLAVIVILAIIMIIAIPSVINTMQNTSKKTFIEFATKIYTKSIEQQITTDSFNPIESTGYDSEYILYSIKDDLGYDSVGDFHGYIMRARINTTCESYDICANNNDLTFLLLWNDDYVLVWNLTEDGAPTLDRKWNKDTDFPFKRYLGGEGSIAAFIGAKDGESILLERSNVEASIKSVINMEVDLDSLNEKSGVEALVAATFGPTASCTYDSLIYIWGGNSTTAATPFLSLPVNTSGC